MRTVQRALLTGVILGLVHSCASVPSRTVPTTQPKETARRDAQASCDALVAGDVERFASFVYPAAIELSGGRDKLLDTLRRGTQDMASKGQSFKSAHAGAPGAMVQARTDRLMVVPIKQVMALPEGELHIEGHVLGVSSDTGRTWTFVDAGRLTTENVRSVIPHFNPELKLPSPSKPIFVPRKPAM